MINHLPGRIAVKVQRCPALEELEKMWRALEARAGESFFLSWVWIGSWLEGMRELPMVLTAHRGRELIGLGLLGYSSRKRLGVQVPALYLNQTGQRSEDSVFIEYNGFLSDSSCEQEIGRACLDYLVNGKGIAAWSECMLSGVPMALAVMARSVGVAVIERSRRASPYVALDRVKAEGKGYLAGLSRNTRYQVRRSMKLYEKKGPLSLAHASCREEAQVWLDALAALHQESWMAKGQAGAFANDFFKSFCTRLVLRGFATSSVDVVRVCAGPMVIGYLLNFNEGRRVMNYQSGFAYPADEHYKPGLTTHVLAIEDALGAGKSVYSFLAGDSQYKSSLSNASEDLYWLALQRKSGLLFLERSARRIKSWINVRSGRS